MKEAFFHIKGLKKLEAFFKVEYMITRKGTFWRSPLFLTATGFFCLLALTPPAFAVQGQTGAQGQGQVKGQTQTQDQPKLQGAAALMAQAMAEKKNRGKQKKPLAGAPLALSLLRQASDFERENKLDEAIAKTTESIKTDPRFMPARVKLGNLFIKKGLLDKAMKVFEDALKQNPELHAAKAGEGVILFKKGNLPGALADLKEALVLNPDPVEAYYEMGNVYEKMDQPGKALEAYKKGIEKLKQGRH